MTGVLLTLVLGQVLPVTGPGLTLEQAQAEIGKILGSGPMASAKVGIDVVSLTHGRPVFSKNADVLMSPASNLKLVTSAAALRYLRPEFRFRTEVYADGPIRDGTLEGNLYIRGGGDPSLVSERVWYLANELWHSGLRRVTGDLVGDDSYFDEVRQQAGWDEDSSDGAYQAMASGLSVNFNTITVRVLPTVVGKPARLAFDPPSAFGVFDNATSTWAGKRTKLKLDVSPLAKEQRDLVRVSGKIHARDTGRAFWRKVDFPTEFAIEAIRGFIDRAGIAVDGRTRRGLAPVAGRRLLVTESVRLSEVVDDLNKTSNNFMAEQLLKTLGAEILGAPGTWEKGLEVVRQYLSEVGIPAGSYTVRNGSGLGDVNRVTPHQLVQVLIAAWRDPMLSGEYVSSLGVAGASGTLRHRMLGTPGAYRVRAKTGSLSGACTLSGYIQTYSGEVLAFSILVNGFRKLSHAHEAQDRIATVLAQLADAH